MVATRLITVLTINQGVLFRSRNFIPDYRYTVNFIDGWDIDEVIVLDISRERTPDTKLAFSNMLKNLTKSFFVPITVGGGLRSVDDCLRVLDLGADKVVLNSAVFDNPELLTKVAGVMGSQSVVASIDARQTGPDSFEVMKNNGKIATGIAPDTWAKRVESLGAGEIMLTSVDNDGTLEGYQNALNSLVAECISVPLLVAGGAGRWQHFVDAVNLGGANGVCTTNIYHFTDSSIRSAKKFMCEQGLKVRL